MQLGSSPIESDKWTEIDSLPFVPYVVGAYKESKSFSMPSVVFIQLSAKVQGCVYPLVSLTELP